MKDYPFSPSKMFQKVNNQEASFPQHIYKVTCPVCGWHFVHAGLPENENGILKIPFYCEEGHEWQTVFEHNKGTTFVFSRDPRKPELCVKCEKEIAPIGRNYCRSCYDEVFYNGVPRGRCVAINKNGNRCAREGHYQDGYCPIHRNASQQSVQWTGGDSAAFQALSTPEVDSASGADTTPPTSH